MQKIRKGDDVIVTAGRDKGRRGTVQQVRDDGRLIVDNVNMVKKHQKPNPQQGVGGGIIEKEAPIHVSNVMVFNPTRSAGDRVGIKTLADGRKVRYFKSDGEVVDV
ncbi:MAG: 50S ribosomal protein L24 [Halofilum sp. (in: g-proteobacteria)]